MLHTSGQQMLIPFLIARRQIIRPNLPRLFAPSPCSAFNIRLKYRLRGEVFASGCRHLNSKTKYQILHSARCNRFPSDAQSECDEMDPGRINRAE